MTNSFQRQYSFPNVSVRETIRGPQPFTSIWRNTIGIAAPFTKGPLVAEINSRQQLVNLFGEDNSVGSIAVRQAMLQGATNFVISRAIPRPLGAYGSVSLASNGDPTNPYPTIGLSNNRTVGLRVDYSYVSNPNVIDSNTVAYAIRSGGSTRSITPVTSVDDSEFGDLDFSGLGYISLVKAYTLHKEKYAQMMRNAGQEAAAYNTLTFDDLATDILETTTGTKVFKVRIPKTDANVNKYIDRNAFIPGMEIQAGTGAGAPAFTGAVKIVSELFEDSSTHWAFYVKGLVATAGTGSAFIKLKVPTSTAGTDPTIDVFEVKFTPYSNEVLANSYVNLNSFVNQLNNVASSQLPFSYLTYDRKADSGNLKNIVYYVQDTSVGNENILTEVKTGVSYKLGATSDTYSEVISTEQTITILKSYATVGETNTGAAGFPDTNLAFQPGESVISVLNQLKGVLYSNPVLSALNAEITVNTNAVPFSLSFQLGVPGSIGNNVKYKVVAYSDTGTITDIAFSDGVTSLFEESLNLVGGVDPVTPANRTLYGRNSEPVLYVEAISPGFSGNNVRLNIKPVNDNNFIIEVKEESLAGGVKVQNEVFYLSNTSVDVLTGVYPETLGSNFIRAYYIPAVNASRSQQGTDSINFNLVPLRVAPASVIEEDSVLTINDPTHPGHLGAQYLQNIALLGGTEPNAEFSEVSEQAYIDAIDRLADRDVAIIIAPGLIAGDVRYTKAVDTLIQQANQSTPYNGLRIAVLAAPPRLTPTRAEILGQQYSSSRLVIVGGWSSLATANGAGLNNYSSEGFYAGLLSVSDTYTSPASSFSNNFVTGARTVDTDSRLEVLDSITNSNIELMYFDRVAGKIKFLNGRTTAGDLDNRWIAIRRQSDHIIMNIARNLEWAKSAPNNAEVQSRVAAAVDAILKNEQRRGAIASFIPTYINNSDFGRIAQGFMDIVITWIPVFPADYISVEVIRSISNQFSLQLSNS